MSLMNQETVPKFVILIGPSGSGKTNILEGLGKQGGFIRPKSKIEFKPLQIKLDVKNGYTLIGRMPRARFSEISIWKKGLPDPYKHNYDLNDKDQRELLESQLSKYTLGDVDWGRVSLDDLGLYEWMNTEEFYKFFEQEGTAQLNVIDIGRGYDFRPEALGGDQVLFEADLNSLPLYYQTLKNYYGETLNLKVAYFSVVELLNKGQLTEFRKEPLELVAQRLEVNKLNQANFANPQSDSGRVIQELRESGNLITLLTNYKIFRGKEGDEKNGKPYKFIENERALQLITTAKSYPNTDQEHIRTILDVCNGRKRPKHTETDMQINLLWLAVSNLLQDVERIILETRKEQKQEIN